MRARPPCNSGTLAVLDALATTDSKITQISRDISARRFSFRRVAVCPLQRMKLKLRRCDEHATAAPLQWPEKWPRSLQHGKCCLARRGRHSVAMARTSAGRAPWRQEGGVVSIKRCAVLSRQESGYQTFDPPSLSVVQPRTCREGRLMSENGSGRSQARGGGAACFWAVSRFTLMMATAALLTLASGGAGLAIAPHGWSLQQLTCPRIHRTDASMMADGRRAGEILLRRHRRGGGQGRRSIAADASAVWVSAHFVAVASTPFITHQQPPPRTSNSSRIARG